MSRKFEGKFKKWNFRKNTENYYGWHMVIRKKRCFGAKNTFWGSKGANYVVFFADLLFFLFCLRFWGHCLFRENWTYYTRKLAKPTWKLKSTRNFVPTVTAAQKRKLLVPKNELSKKYFLEKYIVDLPPYMCRSTECVRPRPPLVSVSCVASICAAARDLTDIGG